MGDISKIIEYEQKRIFPNQKIPINIVTSTYLDPHRYYKYIYIWSYLGVLFFSQLLQYYWIKNKSKVWKEAIEKW